VRSFVEVISETDAAELHRQDVAYMAHDPFVFDLVEEFGFPDRVALAEVLVEAEALKYSEDLPEFWDDRVADTLNELEKPLDDVIRLLEDKLNAYRIWGDLGDPDRVLDLLRDVRATARAEHRKRDRRGPLPPLRRLELRGAVEGLATFWVATKGRFEHSHAADAWPPNADGVEEPKIKNGGPGFVFRVIKHFAPDRLRGLRTLLRDIDVGDSPRPAGKPRGRPKKR
jgi:hypothetical protein